MKYIFSIALAFFATKSIAQIQVGEPEKKNIVGEVKYMGNFRGELSYKIEDKDTVYTLMLNNDTYSRIVDLYTVSFSGEDGTLEKLYKLMKSVFAKENVKNKDYKVNFKLGDSDVIVSNFRTMGISACMFFTKEGYTNFSESHIDKLFGKKK